MGSMLNLFVIQRKTVFCFEKGMYSLTNSVFQIYVFRSKPILSCMYSILFLLFTKYNLSLPSIHLATFDKPNCNACSIRDI